MTIKKLKLNAIDNELTATIDNEIKRLTVYEISKFETKFYHKSNLDTAFNIPIDLKLLLTYKDEEEYNVEKGFVKVRITNLSQKIEYYNEIIKFTNGIIQTQIPNQLSMGKYLMHIEYTGTLYYESAQLTLQFNIHKRKAKCVFDTEEPKGYPNDDIEVGVTVLDDYNGKKISNCLIRYFFNNNEYTAYTNDKGFATLKFCMPSVDANNCQMKYPLKVLLDNTSYQLTKQTYINVMLQQYNTSIIYEAQVNKNNVQINGSVMGYENNNDLINVEYGTIDISVGELTSLHIPPVMVNENGFFSTSFTINTSYNGNVVETEPFECYSKPKQTNINVEILDQLPVTRDYIKRHNINFKAQVTYENKVIKDGMIIFIISQENEEVYRYVTQLDSNGEAFFHFDVSTPGVYQIQAQYRGIFEYQNSYSTKKTYEIAEED